VEKVPVRARKLAVIIILSIIASFFIGLMFWSWYIPEQRAAPMQLEISDTHLIGFNTDKDKLYFGTVAPEGYAERQTTVVSAQKRMVVIKIEGDIAPFVAVSENKIILEPGVPKDIFFRATVPPGATAGNYTGTAYISYHRVLW
jgi:hypothetical protein